MAKTVPGCAHCGDRHEFTMPADVIEAAASGTLVLFAGAGVSTEGKQVFSDTFYERMAGELGIEEAELGFPELMTKYADQPNGRAKLLIAIKERFDYLKSFPEVYRTATMFHRTMCSVPHLDEIYTTNWDDLFERETGATPIVSTQDFVFWNLPGRKVFKLHGSVNSYGSIVATTEDYEKAYQRLHGGLVGACLKLSLATKTVLFVGYSGKDEDFRLIHQALREEMEGVFPTSYAVVLDEASSQQFSEIGIHPIRAEATHFMEVLKAHLVADGHMIPDEWFDGIYELHEIVKVHHEATTKHVNTSDNPAVIYTLSYQDGVLHACEHLKSMFDTGLYSCPGHVVGKIETYQQRVAECRRRRHYFDWAYVTGYLNGLMYLVADARERRRIPYFFVPGHKRDLRTPKQFFKALKQAERLHRTAFRKAAKYVEELPDRGKQVVIHHRPFLA